MINKAYSDAFTAYHWIKPILSIYVLASKGKFSLFQCGEGLYLYYYLTYQRQFPSIAENIVLLGIKQQKSKVSTRK